MLFIQQPVLTDGKKQWPKPFRNFSFYLFTSSLANHMFSQKTQMYCDYLDNNAKSFKAFYRAAIRKNGEKFAGKHVG